MRLQGPGAIRIPGGGELRGEFKDGRCAPTSEA
jgi:hypothetical protein